MGSMVAKYAFLPPPPEPMPRDLPSIIVIQNQYHHSVPCLNIKRQGAKYTLLFSHGNAEDLSGFISWFEGVSEILNVNVFAYEYSGYGWTKGPKGEPLEPSEAYCYANIRAAYEHLVTSGVPPQNIIPYGRSLGTGPTCELGSTKPVGGIILQSPLTSCIRVAYSTPFTMPFDLFPNIDKVGKFKAPTLIIHGTHDNVISVTHGQSLYNALKCPKRSLWINGAGHNNIESSYRTEYFSAMLEFLQSLETQK